MISQVEGMAKALGADFSHKVVRLKFSLELASSKIYSNFKYNFER